MQFSVGKTLWFHFPYSFGCEKILLTSCDPCVVSGLHKGNFVLKSLSPPPPPPSRSFCKGFMVGPNGSAFRHYDTSHDSNLCTFKRKNVP